MKKGQTQFKFIRPMSNMRQVLSAVEQGNCTPRAIQDASGLSIGEVANALKNLVYNKFLQAANDRNRRKVYFVFGEQIPWEYAELPENIKGVRSIFNCK